jgi:KUP system potassium uptake protein
MEGLKLVTPAFENFVLPVTLAILIGLFMIQRRGTASIGRLFGPVMVIWFVVIGCSAPSISGPRRTSSRRSIRSRRSVSSAANPVIAFAVMGGVFLALTGAEALYADMGHVGPPPSAAPGSAWSCRRCC